MHLTSLLSLLSWRCLVSAVDTFLRHKLNSLVVVTCPAFIMVVVAIEPATPARAQSTSRVKLCGTLLFADCYFSANPHLTGASNTKRCQGVLDSAVITPSLSLRLVCSSSWSELLQILNDVFSSWFVDIIVVDFCDFC